MHRKCHLIKRVNLSTKENSTMKQHLHQFYNQPENYFNVKALSPLSPLLFTLKKSKSFSTIPFFQRTAKRKLTELKRGFLTSSTFIATNKTQPQTIFKATEEEMTKLFDYYETIKEDPANYLSNISNSLKSKATFTRKIFEQERHLSSIKESNALVDKVASAIRRKIKRSGSLLMDQIDDYRVKKETRCLLSKNDPFPDYWRNSLRQKSVECNKQKIDNNSVIVNNGTMYNPKWEIKARDNLIEKVRNPMKKSQMSFFDKLSRTFNETSPSDSQSKAKNDLSKIKAFTNNASALNVTGKNLLKTEYDMFKSSKAKKFIYCVYPKEIQGNELFDTKTSNNAKVL